MKNQIHKLMNSKKVFIICVCTLIAMYLGAAAFFKNHFYFQSQINGIDVSCKTINDAEKQISSAMRGYTLELEERNNVKEKIKGEEIGLTYKYNEEIKKFKESQNPLTWITSFLKKNQVQIKDIMTFNKNSLKEKIDKLAVISNKNIVEPKEPSFKYSSNGYEVVDEVKGNKIKREAIYQNVENAILSGKKTLNLDAAGCYENPKYTSKSKEVTDAKNLLNKYTGIKISYSFGNRNEIVDGATINKWLDVDKDMNVIFNDNNVRIYVDSLASKYNTFAKTRSFKTATGKTVQVSGGNYGWIIHKAGEVKELIEIVKKGKDVAREPIYSQTAFSHDSNDIGDTYVEINITKQHLWFYKKGALVTEGDVVTGNVSTNFGTPLGTYRINYKEKKATLKGEDYSTPVDFWMPFNGNIGIHDATWRNEFGKDIYLKNGSHGCVNSPYNLANAIFDNIQPGTPVVCYTE